MICLFHFTKLILFSNKIFCLYEIENCSNYFPSIMTFTIISYNNVLASVHYYLVSVLSTLAYKQVSNKV